MEVFEKSQTVDPEVRAFVYNLVSAVGGNSAIDDGRYVLGDDALACLKDLKRWLLLYDERTGRHDVKRCLAEANLVKGDLLEILSQWTEEVQENKLKNKIALATLELLVPVTWPLELEEERATVNHHRHVPYLQLAHVGYKRAILQHETVEILRTVIRIGLPSMATPRRERAERDDQIIQIMLYLFRNVAMIHQPHNLPSQGDENDVSRSATIDAFYAQDVLQLLLTVASAIGEEYVNQDVVVLEILFHLLKGIDPSSLWKEKKQLANERSKELQYLLQKEKAMFSKDAKNAPTRHNRFGTMLWVRQPDGKMSTVTGQDAITNQQHTLDKMDKSKKWNKPKPRRRQADDESENNEFSTEIFIGGNTRRILRTFVSDFLDSGFNPLFTHIRKAVEREQHRVQPIHSRQYFYLMSWFLQAESARQRSPELRADTDDTTVETSFAYIASVMTQENFVLLNRTMQRAIDDKSWKDVHVTILAFTQILNTIVSMSESPSEDDQEIAENIQNRIFYEETTQDRVIQVLRGYNEQGFHYLNAVTELAHVFLRMLERYSKQNADMQIRSKRRARRKRKAAVQESGQSGENEGAEEAEDDAADEQEAHRTVSERKFDFTRFAAKFMTQPCINTFVRFTTYYADLSPEQLKRAHRFFYRAAFKMELSLFLFRVDILHLFNRMIKGPGGLNRDAVGKETFKEWEDLVRQIFRKCIKKTEERKELIVEMLFSKIPATVFFLEHGYDREVVKSKPRAPVELEIKPGLSKEQQIGVALTVLVNQGRLDSVAWVRSVLSDAADERESFELEHVARSIQGPDQRAGNDEKPPSILVKPDSDDRRTALFRDKHLRLLLTILGFQRIGASDDPEASWYIPSPLRAQYLKDCLELIKRLEYDPPTYEESKPAESFLRNKTAARRSRRPNEMSSDEDSGDSEIDESRFEPGGPTPWKGDGDNPGKPKPKRKLRRAAEEISEEERKRRAEERGRKEKEKNSKIKSALRITDSDEEEDAERDEEFFRLEEERRGRMKGAIREALLSGIDGEKAKSKRKSLAHGEDGSGIDEEESSKPKKRRKAVFDEETDDEDAQADDPMQISSDEQSDSEMSPMRWGSDHEDKEEEDTPLSSQQRGGPEVAGKQDAASMLAATSRDAGAGGAATAESDEEDVPVSKPARRNPRALFIEDSDSE